MLNLMPMAHLSNYDTLKSSPNQMNCVKSDPLREKTVQNIIKHTAKMQCICMYI